MGAYVVEGIRHILFGADHLLFVLGLLLIVQSGRMLVKTVTAFTVAHDHAGLATLGLAHVPAPPLNATIALSILLLGPEIVRVRRGQTSLTVRRPWVVAFAFGLLHGFGFASALTEIGLPQGDIPLALFCFNVGVEVGQLYDFYRHRPRPAGLCQANRFPAGHRTPRLVGRNLWDRNHGCVLVHRAPGGICSLRSGTAHLMARER